MAKQINKQKEGGSERAKQLTNKKDSNEYANLKSPYPKGIYLNTSY